MGTVEIEAPTRVHGHVNVRLLLDILFRVYNVVVNRDLLFEFTILQIKKCKLQTKKLTVYRYWDVL